MLPVEEGLKMGGFTAKKLKEIRALRDLSQSEVAKRLNISEWKLRSIEANEHTLTTDDLLEFAKLYKVDVRELLLESYAEESEEQILCNRYISLCRLYDQLSTKDKEDVFWVIKQRIAGLI
jgi:transcriptional regulator with XRE-family HTH domain